MAEQLKIKLSEPRLSALDALSKIDLPSFEELKSSISQMGLLEVDPSRLEEMFTPLFSSQASAVAWSVLMLHRLRREHSLDANGAMEVVYQEYRRSRPAQSESSDQLQIYLREMAGLSSLGTFERALNLRMRGTSQFIDASITTDMRPIFSADASQIEATMITHALSLKYLEGTEDRAIWINLDDEDIQSLIDSCQRARKKASVLSSIIREKTGLNTVVLGEKDDT